MRRLIVKLYQYFNINIELKLLTINTNWGNLIIATKRGLYQLTNKKLKLISLGEFYGITIVKDRVFVLHKLSAKEAAIISFKLKNHIIRKNSKKIIIRGLDEAIHQIDYFNNKLYYTDTHNNRIITSGLNGDNMGYHNPIGKLTNGRDSPNYGHINSIFSDSKNIFILCHNDSVQTKRKSEILITDFNFNLIHIIHTNSESAHNVIKYKDSIYHCDSLNSQLKKDNNILFTADEFTRGLAITENEIIVGDSNYAKRSDRKKSKGNIYLLEHNGFLKSKLRIPGMIQEIRRIDKIDYGLSLNNF